MNPIVLTKGKPVVRLPSGDAHHEATIAEHPSVIRIHGQRLFQGDGTGADSVVPLKLLEQRAIRHALKVTKGSVEQAAKLLGMARATLYRRVHQYGIDR